MTADIFVAELPAEHIPQTLALVGELAGRYTTAEDPGLLAEVAVWAQELPRALRARLHEFRLTEPSGACLVTGYPVDDAALGPTPAHWGEATSSRTLGYEVFFLMCASLIGEPFAWSTEQRGRVMHNVVPMPEDRKSVV